MSPIIAEFSSKVTALGKRSLFAPGVSNEKLDEFEQWWGAKLPPLMREFYHHFNGGCIADDSWSESELDDPELRSTILWNSNTFVSVEEWIADNYFDQQGLYGGDQRWFLPVIATSTQEVLVLEPNREPILDAFHECPPEDWKVLYPSFESLLRAYIDTEGDIQTIAQAD